MTRSKYVRGLTLRQNSGLVLGSAVPADDPLRDARPARITSDPAIEVVHGVRADRSEHDGRVDQAGLDREHVVDHPAAHRPPSKADALVVDRSVPRAQGVHGVDDVLGVAEPQVRVGLRIVVGTSVVAVVDVQGDEAPAGEPVQLASHALAVHVDVRVDVAVGEDDRRVRPLAARDVQHPGDAELAAAVDHVVLPVGVRADELPSQGQTSAVVLALHECGQGDRVGWWRRRRRRRRRGCGCGAFRG